LIAKRPRSARPAALAIATAANLALLWLLASPGRYQLPTPEQSGPRPVDVSLVAAAPLRSSAATHPAPSAAPRAARPSLAVPAATSSRSPPAEVESPPADGLPAASAIPDLVAALRRGPVGCAHPDAAWMTDADRDVCRHRLAAGAANAPYLHGMAAAKLSYYDAVAKAEEDWRTGRDPGHLPFIFCGFRFGQGRGETEAPGPHALKLGPCYIEPPKGALSQDVDVPPP